MGNGRREALKSLLMSNLSFFFGDDGNMFELGSGDGSNIVNILDPTGLYT